MNRTVVEFVNVDLTKGPIPRQSISCALVLSNGFASVVVNLDHREMLKAGLRGAERKPARSPEDFDRRQTWSPRNLRNFDSSNIGSSDNQNTRGGGGRFASFFFFSFLTFPFKSSPFFLGFFPAPAPVPEKNTPSERNFLHCLENMCGGGLNIADVSGNDSLASIRLTIFWGCVFHLTIPSWRLRSPLFNGPGRPF